MTSQQIIEHWRQGARDALETARWNCETGKYELCLFHCHLAAEKALKALYMEQFQEEAPYTHDLPHLARLVRCTFSKEEMELLSDLTRHAVDARYGDPVWAEKQANRTTAELWVQRVSLFLSSFLHET